MAVEAARGCGYRKVGGFYIVGSGVTVGCDRLPVETTNCPVCGGGLKFSRAWTWLDWRKYAGDHGDQCTDNILGECPVCHPSKHPQPYGLLWVGEKFYSPEAFVRESTELGISRRLPYTGEIPRAPKNLKLGETWVLFAHKHVIKGVDDQGKEIMKPAIFRAFRPQRLELLLWDKDATEERLSELTEAGITPVIIPDGDKDHDPSTPVGLAKDDKAELENEILFKSLRSRLGK